MLYGEIKSQGCKSTRKKEINHRRMAGHTTGRVAVLARHCFRMFLNGMYGRAMTQKSLGEGMYLLYYPGPVSLGLFAV